MTRAETFPGHPLRFAGEDFIARISGALWWPAGRMLIVSDLHLGRSERYARRGGPLLPPWEVADTLDRLAAEIAALDPATVVSLGDAFDDDHAAGAMAPEALARIRALAAGRDWLWISGNHDRNAPGPGFPGRGAACVHGPFTLRHEAGHGAGLGAGPGAGPEPARGPDISGHLHPAIRLAGRSWRCFALGREHLILPAFGTYTGGLDIRDPVFRRLAGGGIAIACSPRNITVPIPAGTRAVDGLPASRPAGAGWSADGW